MTLFPGRNLDEILPDCLTSEDPLAGLSLGADDFGWITDELVAVANYCCGGHICSMLEGGYDLGALSRGVSQHVAALLR